MKRRGLGCTIADPSERKSWFAAFLEGERDAGKNWSERSDLAYWGNDSTAHVTYMKVSAVTGRVDCGEILAKHVRDRYSHFMAGTGVPDHGSDLVDLTIQGMDVADGYGFLSSTEPSFCKDSLADPAPKGDIVKPKTHHPGIHGQKLVPAQLGNDLGPLAILLERFLEFLQD
jgi:hypothetical protein